MAVRESTASSSDDLLRIASKVFPGGSLGHYVIPGHRACVMRSGSGARIVDTDGRQYVDFVLGSGPLILGHAHPAVVDSVSRQIALGSQFYWLSEPVIELAELIAEAVPCAGMVKLASTGAEATFYALRLARAFTSREKLLRFHGSYHGGHDFGVSGPSAGIPASSREATLWAAFNDLDSVRGILEREEKDVAAVIVEPFQRMTSPRPGFLEGLRRLCSDIGALLIFDEVVTGFRSAWGGAQERYGVTPDLATYGKIIGGGYPLSAVVGRDDVMSLLDPTERGDRFTYMSGTLSGNPVSAAAGLATLRELRRPGAYDYLCHLGDYLRRGLQRLAADHGGVQVLGDGALGGFVLSNDDPYDPESFSRSDRKRLKRIESTLVEQGLFVNLSAQGKMYLSTAHTEADLDLALETLDSALSASQA